MEKVVVAIGSNVGDRIKHMTDAARFLDRLSERGIVQSSLYLTEPVGPSSRYFLNAVVTIHTSLEPEELIREFKYFEKEHGRNPEQPRWSARTIDLDVICYGDLVIQTDSLIIPHPEYRHRLFVLEPLADIEPEWRDPDSGEDIRQLIDEAPSLQVKRISLEWQV